MNASQAEMLIARLAAFPPALRAALACFSPQEARWKPPSGNWSVLEIIGHLADEEVEDFRTRVRSTLEDPSRPWPPIDPEGWAKSRDYSARDPQEALERFMSERRTSIEWLRSLVTPDWSKAYVHPKFGAMVAGNLLAAWAAHDALHLRQIAKRLFELAERDAFSGDVGYAGEWRA